jgi:16S rRNA (cytosine967-C5)-methyltransferase
MSNISDAGKAPRKRPTSKNFSSKATRKPSDKSKRQKSQSRSKDGKQDHKPDNRRSSYKARKSAKGSQQKSRDNPGTTDKNRSQQVKRRSSGPKGIAAREAAVVLLHNVLGNRRPLDEILVNADQVPELAFLSKADRGFARAIASTALRRHGQLLDVIGHFMEKGIPDRSGPLREVLISAAAQLLFLDSPPHAVLNIAVQQVKRDHNSRRYDKLANAVLRRVSEKGADIIARQDAGRLNTPNWLWNSWVRAYGKQTAKYICEAHLHQAQLDLSVKKDPQYWARVTGGILLPTGTIRLKHKGRIENIDGFEDGTWWVQDAAAALPVKLLGKKIKGNHVADLAAAPGGKTAQIAAMGASVTAIDWSAGRLRRLQENLERLELDAEIVCGDILQWKPKQKFDAVLLDAPCTATGTIRRHPDLPFLKRQSDIAELAQIQASLLDRALEFIKPGGTLIYCTCSLQPEEGPDQIAALLMRNKAIQCDPVNPAELAGHEEWITEQGHLRTLPFHRPFEKADPGMDGFFAARIFVQ